MAHSFVFADNILPQKAGELANSFFSGKSAGVNSQGKSVKTRAFERVSEPVITLTDSNGKPTVYVFNMDGQGFVVVAGESGTRDDILGYSLSGHIDAQNINPGFQRMLNSYSDDIIQLRMGVKMSAPAPTRTASSVAPLLGDIEWGQEEPFNRYTQVLEGKHAPTGCVTTAIAQVMRYYEWPKEGKGSNSYVNNGETLSADFNHKYNWDLMLPSYKKGYTEAQADAVARLMSDVGIALDMHYQAGTSGSSVKPDRLHDFFDYDMGMVEIYLDYCTLEDFEGVMRSEFDAGRPVLYEASNGVGGHEFIADGYDTDGKIHFNYGWDGESNGYFLTTACNYSESPRFIYGIEKNHGGCGRPSPKSTTDFLWKEGNTITCDISIGYMCCDPSENLDFAVQAKNVNTGKVSYHIIKSATYGSAIFLTSFDFDATLSDGTYELSPYYRLNGGDWQRIFFNAKRQGIIDLKVNGGVKEYANNGIYEETDEGRFLVNDLYYTFIENEAYVTYKNDNYNSYKNSVINIPASVTYEGVTYPVVGIDSYAFHQCTSIEEVNFPSSVEKIDFAAFSTCSNLKRVNFPKDSQLAFLGNYAFNQCTSLERIEIPSGCSYLGSGAFQLCMALKHVDMPLRARELPYQDSDEGFLCDYVFTLCTGLETVKVHWGNPSEVESWIFDQVDVSKIRLLVPKGTKSKYSVLKPWKYFIIEETDGVWDVADAGKVEIDGLWYTCDTQAKTAKVAYKNQHFVSYSQKDVTIPATVSHNGTTYTVEAIDNNAFAFCTNLQILVINADLAKIDNQAFRGCYNLSKVEFKVKDNKGLTTGDWSFAGCQVLKEIVFPKAVTKIRWGSFRDCKNLQKVEVSITDSNIYYGDIIEDFSFEACTSLSDFYIHWKEPKGLSESVFENPSAITLHVEPGYKKTFSSLPVWQEMNIVEDASPNAIETIFETYLPTEIYDLSGRKVNADSKGIQIQKYSDGSVRKITK